MIQKVSTVFGWSAFAFIVYATLSPINLRPVVTSLQLEHFGAFGLVGLALGLAYPKHLLWIALIVVGSALGLEVLQILIPDRHGRLVDAFVKAAGATCGIGISHFVWLVIEKGHITLTGRTKRDGKP